MAVFVAAADESDGPLQTGPFVYGGFVAPHKAWEEVFAPAWESRVLNREPRLALFHMTEIRNPKWQRRNGFTDEEAQVRIDAAIRVIAEIDQLKFARAKMDGGFFRQVFGQARIVRQSGQSGTYRLEPDYLGFLGFARGVLEHVQREHPDAERVDFVVERKTTVSHYLPNYLEMIVTWAKKNNPALLDLIGEVLPGDKTRVPLQAADLAMWHVRRQEAGESEQIDKLRLYGMFKDRSMVLNEINNDDLEAIGRKAADLRWRSQLEARRATGDGA